MTTIQIQVLLAIWAAGEVHSILLNPKSPAIYEALDWLLDQGLVEHKLGTVYDATPKGNCLVEAMKSLPMPVQNWSMPT